MGPISIRSDLSCRYLYSYTLVRCADSGADPLLGRSQGHPEDVEMATKQRMSRRGGARAVLQR